MGKELRPAERDLVPGGEAGLREEREREGAIGPAGTAHQTLPAYQLCSENKRGHDLGCQPTAGGRGVLGEVRRISGGLPGELVLRLRSVYAGPRLTRYHCVSHAVRAHADDYATYGLHERGPGVRPGHAEGVTQADSTRAV